MADDTIFGVLARALEDAAHDLDPTLPEFFPPQGAALEAALADLRAAAAAALNATDLVAWLSAAQDWVEAARDVADELARDQRAGDELFVRLLQSRLPRIGALLTVLGIITLDSGTPPVPRVDWVKLRAFLTDPETLVREDTWAGLFADLGVPLSARLPSVIAALLIAAPRTLIALYRGGLRVGKLPVPAARSPGAWRDFRAATDEWISLTIPFGDPTKPVQSRKPAASYDLRSGISPDLSGTLAFRGNRRLVNGQPQTDFEAWLGLAATGDKWQHDIDDFWRVTVRPGISVGIGYDGDWHGAFRPFIVGPGSVPDPGDAVSVEVTREPPGDVPDILIGPPDDARIVMQDLMVFLRLREASPVFELGVDVRGFSLILPNRWWRVFGADETLLRDGLRFDADFVLAVVEGKGVQFNLSASGLQATLVVDKVIQLGPVRLTLHRLKLHLRQEATADRLSVWLELRVHASAKVGPVTAVVDGLGMYLGWRPELGHPRRLRDLIAPTGLGIQISLPPTVQGGGFLDFTGGPRERYAGALWVQLATFGVTAFGMREKLPSGDVSMVVVLGARFAIPLPFNFFLTGIGGVLGIHRRIDTNAMRERLTSGAAGNVLFADDPIANAPAVLEDLGAIFPAAQDRNVVGPTVQLSWLKLPKGSFAEFNLGIFLELPGPSKIVILGSIRARIRGVPDNVSLVDLRLDLVGEIDFEHRLIAFDASLINSRALQVFRLTGDATFRLSWGDRPYMLLSIGGFHPRWKPEPPLPFSLLEMTRLAFTLDALPKNAWLRLEGYFAVGSNTLQFGGALEVGYAVDAGILGLYTAVGTLYADALINFQPFSFEFDFGASIAIRRNEVVLFSVSLSGSVSGPAPLKLAGRITLKVLFIEITVPVTVTVGSAAKPPVPTIARLTQALQGELKTASNVKALEARDATVAQRPPETRTGDKALVSPLGGLAWSQKRAPLDVAVDRVEGSLLPVPQAVVVKHTRKSGATSDWFSPGSYTTLSESEALNRAAFERLENGIVVGFGSAQATSPKVHSVQVITVRRGQQLPPTADAVVVPAGVLAALEERTGAARVLAGPPVVSVADERFSLRGADGGVLATGLTQTDAHQRARVVGAVALPEGDLVDLGDAL